MTITTLTLATILRRVMAHEEAKESKHGSLRLYWACVQLYNFLDKERKQLEAEAAKEHAEQEHLVAWGG